MSVVIIVLHFVSRYIAFITFVLTSKIKGYFGYVLIFLLIRLSATDVLKLKWLQYNVILITYLTSLKCHLPSIRTLMKYVIKSLNWSYKKKRFPRLFVNDISPIATNSYEQCHQIRPSLPDYLFLKTPVFFCLIRF